MKEWKLFIRTQQKFKNYNVFIVDNNSQDNTFEKIKLWSKNKIKIKEGMILSNEPGFYKKNKFGIRIENLVYVKRQNKRLFFENLTTAPIEKDLINFNLLTNFEKNYLFKYHLNVYSKISKFLNSNEKKWLSSLI